MEQGKKYPKINASMLDTAEDFQPYVIETCLKVITAEFACSGLVSLLRIYPSRSLLRSTS